MAKGQRLLHQGIALARSKKNLEARRILGQAVKQNPRSTLGWLWLASVVEAREQQRYCLERVLRLDPDNEVVGRIVSQVKPEQSRATMVLWDTVPAAPKRYPTTGNDPHSGNSLHY